MARFPGAQPTREQILFPRGAGDAPPLASWTEKACPSWGPRLTPLLCRVKAKGWFLRPSCLLSSYLEAPLGRAAGGACEEPMEVRRPCGCHGL